METNKLSVVLKKAPLPARMTIGSFVLFLVTYWLVTAKSIEPYYLEGLVFALPFVCFGIITFLTVIDKLKIGTSYIITYILIIVLGFASVCTFGYIVLDAAVTQTTDIGKYERVLRLTGYPDNTLIKCFPDKIPSNAKNIVFNYNPAFLQGGENFDLKFETDSDSIKNYIDKFSKQAKWTGKSSDSEAEKNSLFLSAFDTVGYKNLPEDFTIYLIDSKPYYPDDWNHGEVSAVAISEERNEIIFIAEDW